MSNEQPQVNQYFTGQCITSRAIPGKNGEERKKPLYLLQVLINTKNGGQVVDMWSEKPGKAGARYQLIPDIYMDKLTLGLGDPVA